MFIFKNYFLLNLNLRLWNIIFFKNIYYLSFFNEVSAKFVIFPIGTNVIIHDNVLLYIYWNNDINLWKNFNYYFKFFIHSWSRYIIKKIKYRYKGSWVYFVKKKLPGVMLEFGRCHRVFLCSSSTFYYRKKRLTKAHFFSIYGINVNDVDSVSLLVRSVRPFNMYTLRGIRFSRQKFYKRVGKISKYTMFKSKIF